MSRWFRPEFDPQNRGEVTDVFMAAHSDGPGRDAPQAVPPIAKVEALAKPGPVYWPTALSDLL